MSYETWIAALPHTHCLQWGVWKAARHKVGKESGSEWKIVTTVLEAFTAAQGRDLGSVWHSHMTSTSQWRRRLKGVWVLVKTWRCTNIGRAAQGFALV